MPNRFLGRRSQARFNPDRRRYRVGLIIHTVPLPLAQEGLSESVKGFRSPFFMPIPISKSTQFATYSASGSAGGGAIAAMTNRRRHDDYLRRLVSSAIVLK